MRLFRRSLNHIAIGACSLPESLFGSLQDCTSKITCLRVVYGPTTDNFRSLIIPFQYNYLFCIPQHSDIGIVGDNYYLSSFLCAAQHRNKRCIYEFTVKIIFRLIDDQRMPAARR